MSKVDCPIGCVALLRGVRPEAPEPGVRLSVTEAKLNFPAEHFGPFLLGKGKVTAEFEGQALEISSEGLACGEGNPAVIRLRYGTRTQTLYRATFQDEGNWEPVFLGDLDGDGKPDLILNASPKYSSGMLRLFLSSAAGKNELMRQVAIFRWDGC